MEEVKRKKRSPLVPILVILVVLLGGALAYVFSQKEAVASEKEVVQEDKEDLQAEIKKMESRMESLDRLLTDSKLDNNQKQLRIKQLNDEITYLKVKLARAIEAGKLTESLMEEYKGKYARLEYYNKKYRAKIVELEAIIKKQGGQIAELSGSLDSLESINFALEGDVIVKDEKLKVAAKIKAAYAQCFGINSRGKEFEGPTIRQRKIRSFKGCITLLKNDVADIGAKEIYMVVLGPNGKAYHSPATGSGYYSTKDGEQPYTAKAAVDYRREDVRVCVTFKLPETMELDKGNNTVEWYTKRDGSENIYYLLAKQAVRVK